MSESSDPPLSNQIRHPLRPPSPPPPSLLPHLHPDPASSPSEFCESQMESVSFRGLPGLVSDQDGSPARGPLSPDLPETSHAVSHHLSVLKAPAVPQLAVNLQALTIREEPQEQFALYMKVAESGGPVRAPSLAIVQQSLRKAWRACYHEVFQVHRFVFKAIFTSYRDMIWVFKRQPWLVQSEVLLLEFAGKSNEDFEKEQQKAIEENNGPRYQFKYVYVTVRVYGAPPDSRSLDNLLDILRIVGVPSEFHEPSDAMITAHQEYMWGIVRHTVCNPVFDKIELQLPENQHSLVFLHYEKIGRICLFCGMMFHTSGNCQIRQSIVMDRLRVGQSAEDVPFHRLGPWVINPEKLPQNFESNRVFNTAQAAQVLSFNELSAAGEDTHLKLKETNAMARLQIMEQNRRNQCFKSGKASASMAIGPQLQHDSVQFGQRNQTMGPASQAESQLQAIKGGHVAVLQNPHLETPPSGQTVADDSLVQIVNRSDCGSSPRLLDEMDFQFTEPISQVLPQSNALPMQSSAMEPCATNVLKTNSGYLDTASQTFYPQLPSGSLPVSQPPSHKRQASDQKLPYLSVKKRATVVSDRGHADQVDRAPCSLLSEPLDATNAAVERPRAHEFSAEHVQVMGEGGGGPPREVVANVAPGILGPKPSPPPTTAQLRATATTGGSRIRRSRWEPQASPPSGGNFGPPLGATFYKPGAASWVRSGGTTQVGGSSLLDLQEGIGHSDGQLDGQAMAPASKAPRGP